MPEKTNLTSGVPLRDPSMDKTASLVAFPRARSPKRSPDNLPLELSSFIGREREVAQVQRLLSGGTRLVMLYGPGGCGKTRLALAVAQDLLEEFEDGVWWVEACLSLGRSAGAGSSSLSSRRARSTGSFTHRSARGASEAQEGAFDPGQLRAPHRRMRCPRRYPAESLPQPCDSGYQQGASAHSRRGYLDGPESLAARSRTFAPCRRAGELRSCTPLRRACGSG
jgi:DNA polymerase III delta prime subunit